MINYFLYIRQIWHRGKSVASFYLFFGMFSEVLPYVNLNHEYVVFGFHRWHSELVLDVNLSINLHSFGWYTIELAFPLFQLRSTALWFRLIIQKVKWKSAYHHVTSWWGKDSFNLNIAIFRAWINIYSLFVKDSKIDLKVSVVDILHKFKQNPETSRFLLASSYRTWNLTIVCHRLVQCSQLFFIIKVIINADVVEQVNALYCLKFIKNFCIDDSDPIVTW